MFPKKTRHEDPELLKVVRSLPCLACVPGSQVFRTEAHHVTTRGAGGGDLAENLMPLCTEHHREWHLGVAKVLHKYPSIMHWLELAGRQDVIERALTRE